MGAIMSPRVDWHDGAVLIADAQLNAWTVGPNLLATGRCPRCDGSVSRQFYLDGVVLATDDEKPAYPVDVPVFVSCNCDEQHDGRPDGRRNGCGAWWVARLRSSDSGYGLISESDEAVWRAARDVDEAATRSESALTTASEKWVPGVAALTSILGLASVVLARDAVADLPLAAKWAAYLLVVAAVSCATAAVWLSYRAAFGWPRSFSLTSAADVVALARELNMRAASSARYLKAAVGLAVGSVVALVVAVGVLWLVPVEESQTEQPAPTSARQGVGWFHV